MKVFSPFLNGNTTTSGSFNFPNNPSTDSIQNPLTGSLFHDDTDGILKIYTGTQWQVVGEQALPIAGPAQADIEYLLVAGGGGGGGRHAGAGGAGGYLSSSLSSIESGSSITVTVGAGGAGAADGSTIGAKYGTAGIDSSIESSTGTLFGTVTSIGGGFGGGDTELSYDGSGGDGGSGGGATYVGSVGSGTNGQGNNGGNGQNSPNYSGGGGGGASTAGANSSGTQAGAGGAGLASNITGTSVTRAGGGGAGGWTGVTAGNGGTGGGGAGTGNASNTNATSGTTNTGGGGGGGGGETSAAGSGGSGVAIFAYPTASISATGGVRTFFNDRVAHTFNSSGTFSVGGIKTYTHNTLDVFGDSSCIALYNLDGNANDTGGNYNGTASNVTYAQSYINNGGVFNGSSSVIDLGQRLLGGTHSASAWVKTSATGARQVIIGNAYDGSTYGLSVFIETDNILYLQWSHSNSWINVVDSTVNRVNDGSWHHIAYFISAGSQKLYVDGAEVASGTTSSTAQNNTTAPTRIGRNWDASGYFNGSIDQVRIFNKALSTSEIATLYAE